MVVAESYFPLPLMFYNGTAERKSVPLSEVEQYEKLGWIYERSEESKLEAKENQKRLCSEKLTGIKRPGPRSEKQTAQAKEQQARIAANPDVQAKKSLKIANKKWCYDPIIKQNMRLEVIPEGWCSGKYGSSPVGGSTTWNDGVRNHRVKQGEQPDPSWIKGMVPRG